MKAKIDGQNLKEKQDICRVSKVSHPKCWSVTVVVSTYTPKFFDLPTSSKWCLNPVPRTYWLASNRVWRGENVAELWRDLADTTWTKWSRLTLVVVSHVVITYLPLLPQYNAMKIARHLCLSFPKSLTTDESRERVRQTKSRDSAQNTWLAVFKSIKVMKKEKPRPCYRQE